MVVIRVLYLRCIKREVLWLTSYLRNVISYHTVLHPIKSKCYVYQGRLIF